MKRDKSLTWRRVEPENLDLRGMKVAVIGGTGGIGRAISRFLANRGAAVVVVGQTFRDAGVEGIEFLKADLSLMREAQRVGKALPAESLDMVIFTTGIMAARKREVTAEGIERDMAVSYLSRLVILRELGPRLRKQSPALHGKPRVFIMGFPGYGQKGKIDDLNAEKVYKSWAVHMNTVAGNEMLVLDAKTRYASAMFFGLNPGFIKTNIRSNMLGDRPLLYKLVEWITGVVAPSADDYAERIGPLLVSPDLETHSGAMFNGKGFAVLPSPGLDDTSYLSKFLAASEALIASTGANVGA